MTSQTCFTFFLFVIAVWTLAGSASVTADAGGAQDENKSISAIQELGGEVKVDETAP